MQIDITNPQWLATLMAYHNVTPLELAWRSGVHVNTIRSIASGKVSGTVQRVTALAKALGYSIETRPVE